MAYLAPGILRTVSPSLVVVNGYKRESQRSAPVGGLLQRGPGLTMVEATAVLPEGRISPEDVGICNDQQMHEWAEIVTFAHSQNQKIAI